MYKKSTNIAEILVFVWKYYWCFKKRRKAFELYEKIVIQDYANAQYNWGVCYANGIGVSKNE
jgi:TPR repeat protein